MTVNSLRSILPATLEAKMKDSPLAVILSVSMSLSMVACGVNVRTPSATNSITPAPSGQNTPGTTTGSGTGSGGGTNPGGGASPGGIRFALTGAMVTGRAGHTATLLPNGNVLIVGGGQLDEDDLLVSMVSAELYDADTGTFAPTGELTIAREFHTATLLADGTVLITGGNVFNGYPTWLTPTALAEIYVPRSGTFVSTGPMAIGRSGHTASLLPDGRVLIVGGGPAGGPTAEIYDPNSKTFSAVPGLNEARVGHTATVLASGRVLIAGGQTGEQNDSTVLQTAELFDPNTNSFRTVGELNSPRTGHTATLLADGKVLIAGGASNQGLGVGGVLTGTLPLQTAELFDPDTESFAPTDSMATGRFGHTATLLSNGTVLVFGGFKDYVLSGPMFIGYESYNSAEIFDPATASFTTVGQLNAGRFWHTATLLPNGMVLAVGGIGGNDQALSSAEIFH